MSHVFSYASASWLDSPDKGNPPRALMFLGASSGEDYDDLKASNDELAPQ
jgi:hypothetical protein